MHYIRKSLLQQGDKVHQLCHHIPKKDRLPLTKSTKASGFYPYCMGTKGCVNIAVAIFAILEGVSR